jgi:uncharacterized membrane protein YhhN
MNRVFAILAALASGLYLILPASSYSPGSAIPKMSMCVLLAALAWRHRLLLLAIALLFSATGDALLAIDGAKLFVPALASFLITHLLYAVIFLRASRETPIAVNAWRTIGMIVPILFAIPYAAILWPHLGSLTVPVTLYIFAIVAMAVLSFRVKQVLVPIGALLFMASDSLIAYTKFLESAAWAGAIIWVTYALAQQLITHGLVRLQLQYRD